MRAAELCCGGDSEQLDRGAVVVRHPAADVAGEQRERQFGDHGGEQGLVLQQRGRDLLARGYVAQELDRTLRPAQLPPRTSEVVTRTHSALPSLRT